jgi:hypothetical protein
MFRPGRHVSTDVVVHETVKCAIEAARFPHIELHPAK